MTKEAAISNYEYYRALAKKYKKEYLKYVKLALKEAVKNITKDVK